MPGDSGSVGRSLPFSAAVRTTLFVEGLFRSYHDGAFDGIVGCYQFTCSGNIESRELTL